MRRSFAAFAALVLISPVFADSVTLAPVAWSSARDGGSSANPVVDGQFEVLVGGNVLSVRKNQGTSIQSEYRALYEFSLPPEVVKPGVTINQATLTVPVLSETLPTNDTITVHGSIADATLTVDDFEVSNPVSSTMLFTGLTYSSHTFNVPGYLQSFPGSGNNRVGFVAAAGLWGTSLQWNASASLTIDYTPAQGTPPTLTILSPANGAAYLAGSNIALQATSFDAEDGSRDWAIQWSSSLSGSLGSGGNLLVQLPLGNHVITATLSDTHGNTVSQSRAISVQAVANAPPTATITSPANGAQFNAGTQIAMQGTANDLEQGNLSASIQWVLDGGTNIGTGPSAFVTINTVGPHTLTARVTDSGGLVGQATVNINVNTPPPPPPPPAGYCTTRGNSSYEWIGGVSMNGGGMTSSANGGYADFTSTVITANLGANSITLTPGFASGMYSESWIVWVDLNRNQLFDAGEALASGAGNTALVRTITIPTSTAPGPTRMRVMMAYGTAPAACGTFSWGEAEDYTVNIVAGNPNPPPPAPNYCTSRGQTASYEWIAQTTIAGVTRVSGANGGYADFTTQPAIALVRGANSLAFTSGYASTAYSEQWMAWIDFNRDGTFGNEDWIYGGTGTFSVTGAFNVPVSAVSGTTRMRVQMKYGSAAIPCETFPYGEVEDYAVTIP